MRFAPRHYRFFATPVGLATRRRDDLRRRGGGSDGRSRGGLRFPYARSYARRKSARATPDWLQIARNVDDFSRA